MPKDPKPKADAPYQSRDQSAYDGAKLKPWGPTRADSVTGAPNKKAPTEQPYEFPGAGPAEGSPVFLTPKEAVEGAGQGWVDPAQAEWTHNDVTGGAVAGKPVPKFDAAYSANVPKDGGGTAPLFLQSGKPDEVEKLVSMNIISRATADKIYAKRNEGDPMQKLVQKTPPKPGMDWAPSASSVGPAPTPSTVTSPALPAAPAPTGEDHYSAAIKWARSKWGL